MSMGRLKEKRAIELSLDMWRHIADTLDRKIGPEELGADDLTGLKAAYIHMFQSKETVGYCGGNLPYRTCWLCENRYGEQIIWGGDLCSKCVLRVKDAETGVVYSCKSPGGLYYKCKASLENGDLARSARLAWAIIVKLEKALKMFDKHIDVCEANAGKVGADMVCWDYVIAKILEEGGMDDDWPI